MRGPWPRPLVEEALEIHGAAFRSSERCARHLGPAPDPAHASAAVAHPVRGLTRFDFYGRAPPPPVPGARPGTRFDSDEELGSSRDRRLATKSSAAVLAAKDRIGATRVRMMAWCP